MGNIHIVNMKGKRSITRPGRSYTKGFAIYVDDRGFLSMDSKTVYIPCGGRKALHAILECGLDNPGYSFVNP